MSKRSPTTDVTFTCSYDRRKCTASVTADKESQLAMFQICQKCFDARMAKGLVEQGKAERGDGK